MYRNTRIEWPSGLMDWGPLNLESRGRRHAGVQTYVNLRSKIHFMMFMFPSPKTFEVYRSVFKQKQKIAASPKCVNLRVYLHRMNFTFLSPRLVEPFPKKQKMAAVENYVNYQGGLHFINFTF